ncbi:MAG: glycosyltransferase [Candidatus Omnitrophota bacterium]
MVDRDYTVSKKLSMSEKKISVIIPFYNSQATLKDCLDSFFKNSYKNFEVILVNDCSDDGSLSIARSYECKVIDLLERRGPAYARDRGLSLAEGEVVAFLDSDCIPPKDWLIKISSKLTKDIVGLGGRYEFPRNTNKIGDLFMTYWDPKNIFYKDPRKLVSLSGGNCAFWKSHLLKERPKRELVHCNKRVGGDDTIMCYELRDLGKIVYDPDIFVIHNKKPSLINIFKETIKLGYSGATVTAICGVSLIKEPHRFYKTLTYLTSLAIVSSLVGSFFNRRSGSFLFFLFFYIIIQSPFIFLLFKKFSRSWIVLLYPLVTLFSDLLNLIGNIKRTLDETKKVMDSFLWNIKLVINAINSSSLTKIFLFVTKKCNANCYFCFNKIEGVSQAEKELSLKNIIDITSKIHFLPLLTITGGEPFLRNDIYEISKAFYTNCNTRNITIVTNGALVNRIEEVVEKLLIDCRGLYLTIIVALDNISEKHDSIKGLKGSYEKAITTLERLSSLNFRFPKLTPGINTTIIKENSSDIEEILDYFSSNIKYGRQYLNILRQEPCSIAEPEHISIERYVSLIKDRTIQKNTNSTITCRIKKAFNKSIVETFSNRALKEFKEKRGISNCLAARKFFVIDNDTNVYPCELLRNKIGNLEEEGYDLNKIIASIKAKEVRSKIYSSHCYCRWPCAVAFNGYFDISVYPSIISRALSILKDGRYDKKTNRQI